MMATSHCLHKRSSHIVSASDFTPGDETLLTARRPAK